LALSIMQPVLIELGQSETPVQKVTASQMDR